MAEDEEEAEDEGNVDSVSSRFIRHLLQHLLKGITASNKIVRFRVTQFFALVIPSVTAIDEEFFAKMKAGLVKRLYDRESNIRVQASLALIRLGFGAGVEDESDEDDDGEDEELRSTTVVGRLVDRLAGDASA